MALVVIGQFGRFPFLTAASSLRFPSEETSSPYKKVSACCAAHEALQLSSRKRLLIGFVTSGTQRSNDLLTDSSSVQLNCRSVVVFRDVGASQKHAGVWLPVVQVDVLMTVLT